MTFDPRQALAESFARMHLHLDGLLKTEFSRVETRMMERFDRIDAQFDMLHAQVDRFKRRLSPDEDRTA